MRMRRIPRSSSEGQYLRQIGGGLLVGLAALTISAYCVWGISLANGATWPQAAILALAISIGCAAIVLWRVVARPLARALADADTRRDRLESRLARAQRIGGIGWWGYDLTEDTIEASDEFHSMFGIRPSRYPRTAGEFLGRIHRADQLTVKRALVRTLRSDTPLSVTFRSNFQGRSRYLQLRGEPLLKGAKEPAALVGTLQDLTRFYEEQQERYEFLNSVSHELRTPLTSLHAALRLAQRQEEVSAAPKLATLLDLASNGSERLALLVDDILDSEKLLQGAMRLKPEALAIPDFIEASIAENAAFGAGLGVTYVHEQGGTEDISIPADKHRLMQVMSNLLSNAAKFSAEGDTVRIRAGKEDDWAVIKVVDSGTGIPAAAQPHIFERFVQAHDTTGRNARSSGLGLYIAKGIVEAHRGTLDFLSEEGRGTTFRIWLPLR